MSVFLALTYYSSSFAAIILLLLICHFADAALFFSHPTCGPFFQRPHAWPFLSVPRTFDLFLSAPYVRYFSHWPTCKNGAKPTS